MTRREMRREERCEEERGRGEEVRGGRGEEVRGGGGAKRCEGEGDDPLVLVVGQGVLPERILGCV